MHKFCWIFRFVLCFKTSRRIIFGRTYPHNWKKMNVNKESLAVINKNIFELLSTTALYRIFARDDQIWTISLVFDLHILHNKCCHSRDNWGNHGKKVKIFEVNRKVSLKNSQKDNTFFVSFCFLFWKLWILMYGDPYICPKIKFLISFLFWRCFTAA